MIKILIVDDSATEAMLLRSIFENEKDFVVVGVAKNGEECLKKLKSLKPDIITMDILMPVMNGLETTRQIMSESPIPIVIISSAINKESMAVTFEALAAGALAVLEKPQYDKDFAKSRKRIVDLVRSMSEIHVIKRRFFTDKKVKKSTAALSLQPYKPHYEIVAIGASIGGPEALKKIFSALPEKFPLPIVVVQHMMRGFINGFAAWLDNHTPLLVKAGEDHEVLKAGTVYFAPDQFHMTVERKHGELMIVLQSSPPISGFRPSATVLFESIAHVSGPNAIGMLLTGMGNDGAKGLLEIKKAKGHTLIQDQKSAVVFGMGGVAQSLGAVDKVIELNQIADYLITTLYTKKS